LYQNFGDEVTFTLNPFVYGTDTALKCFDESAPCPLEQQSMQVVTQNPQSVYVPWLVCMDSSGDNFATCDAQVGISQPPASAPIALIDQYLAIDGPINSTPTVYVQGKSVQTTYSAIKRALCNAQSTLSGCSKAVPNNADVDVPKCFVPESINV